jgi:PIN domain nuclease of toxin-antitoxin system
MNLLLDTHAFLWFMEGSERISQRARAEIEAADGVRALSVASAWEMAIKSSLGKLDLAKPLGELLPPLLADSGIELLPIEIADLARVATLPFHHRDPFDRLLAAQALERGFTVVSLDETGTPATRSTRRPRATCTWPTTIGAKSAQCSRRCSTS